MAHTTPVTILSGFLGAGKTTLINYFLSHHSNQPVVILENEFGSVNIDADLLTTSEYIQVVEISNGCVCCTVRGEFTTALHQLLDQRQRGEMNFARLIVETTGLADPGPIIQSFFVDERLRSALQLDAVVTLADCEHVIQHLNEHPVCAAQLGFADRILLTKTDRVNEETKMQAIQRINRINNKAEIFEIVQGGCPPNLWLDLYAFELNDEIKIPQGFHIIRVQKSPGVHFQPLSPYTVSKTSWGDTIQAHTFEAGCLDLHKIGAFMENCIERYGNDMLRYKGVLAIAGNPQRLIVQGVYKVVGFDYGTEWDTRTPPHSRLVIIGRYLPVDELHAAFSAATAI